jgi:colicin import membrane protein
MNRCFKYKERRKKKGKALFNEKEMAGEPWHSPSKILRARDRREQEKEEEKQRRLLKEEEKARRKEEKQRKEAEAALRKRQREIAKQEKAHEAARKALAKGEAASGRQPSEPLQSEAKSTKPKPKNKARRQVRFSMGESSGSIAVHSPVPFQRSSRPRRNVRLPERYRD